MTVETWKRTSRLNIAEERINEVERGTVESIWNEADDWRWAV